MAPFHKIGIVANMQKESVRSASTAVIDYLAGKGCESTLIGERFGNVPEDTDLILVLGGDGTVLGAVRTIGDRDIPVLGINMGHLGYLAEVELGDFESSLYRVLAGEVHFEMRMMLEGSVPGRTGSIRALNDIVITRHGSLRMLKFNVSIGGKYLHTFSADGMIISTPTGSTAYNFSAGGPIVDPTAELFLLTPICAHSVFGRSIVLSTEDCITIEIGEGRKVSEYEAQAAFDGESEILLEAGESIEIRKSGKSTKLIRLGDDSFLNTLRQKMGNMI